MAADVLVPRSDEGDELEQLRLRAETREHYIDELVHDLVGSLGAAYTRAEWIARKLEEGQAEAALASARALAPQLLGLTARLTRLLDESEMEQGALPARRSLCGMLDILTAALEQLDASERRRILMRAADGAVGQWDREQLERVLQNVIDNALKYSPPERPVEIDVVGRDGEVEVVVVDHGIGVRPEDASRIFERFYRSPRARVTSSTGRGLGLYGCRRVVEAHRGRIWVDSPGPEAGSAFHIVLPR